MDSDEEVYSPTSELTPLTTKIHLPSNIKDILSSIHTKDLNSTDEDISKAAADDSEKKCRDPRQRISSVNPAEPPPPGLEDEFPLPCKPDTSLPCQSFATTYMAPVNYAASMPYHYLPPGYISDAYPNQYGPQQQQPPQSMTIDQSKYNNYNQSSYSYNSSGYQQPPPPPPYKKNKKESGFWVSGSAKIQPKKKKFKKKSDRRNKNSWRR